MNYQRTFGSHYPTECIATGTRRDVDDAVIDLVNQYNAFMKQGDIKSANTLLTANQAGRRNLQYRHCRPVHHHTDDIGCRASHTGRRQQLVHGILGGNTDDTTDSFFCTAQRLKR